MNEFWRRALASRSDAQDALENACFSTAGLLETVGMLFGKMKSDDGFDMTVDALTGLRTLAIEQGKTLLDSFENFIAETGRANDKAPLKNRDKNTAREAEK